MHRGLELAKGRAVVGVDLATVDVGVVVLEVGILTRGVYECDVGEGGGGVGLNCGTIGAVVALETIRAAGVAEPLVAVVVAVGDLNVVDLRAGAYGAEVRPLISLSAAKG